MGQELGHTLSCLWAANGSKLGLQQEVAERVLGVNFEWLTVRTLLLCGDFSLNLHLKNA